MEGRDGRSAYVYCCSRGASCRDAAADHGGGRRWVFSRVRRAGIWVGIGRARAWECWVELLCGERVGR